MFSLLQHHPLGAFFRHKSPLLILPPPKGPSSSSLAAGPRRRRRGGGGGGARDELDLEGVGTGVGVGGGERGGGRKRRRRTRGLIAAGKIPIRLSSHALGSKFRTSNCFAFNRAIIFKLIKRMRYTKRVFFSALPVVRRQSFEIERLIQFHPHRSKGGKIGGGEIQTFSIPFSPTEFPRAAIPVRDPHAHAGRSHEIEPEWEIGFASLSLSPPRPTLAAAPTTTRTPLFPSSTSSAAGSPSSRP